MCIAIAKPEGVDLFDNVLKNCFENNSDGAGFAYVDGDKIKIRKGFFTLKDFKEAYEDHKSKQLLLHFRIRTHGDVNVHNCHPFFVTPTLAMIHNGVITGFGSASKSDTLDFIEKIIRPAVVSYGNSIVEHPSFQELVENMIGWSKLMFLNADNKKITIYNEGSCNESSSVIFSNLSWQDPPKKYSTSRHTVWDTEPYMDYTHGGKSRANIDHRTSYGIREPYNMPKREVDSIQSNMSNIKYSRNDFVKISRGMSHTLGENHVGDILMINKVYSDYTCDMYNLTQEFDTTDIPTWVLDVPTEQELMCLDSVLETREGEEEFKLLSLLPEN